MGLLPRTGPSKAGPGRINKAPWNGTSRERRSQEEARTRTGTSGEDQDGKQPGPPDWNIREAADRSPGLEQPGMKASGPGLERPGLNKKEEKKAQNNRQRKNRTPEEWRFIRGEPVSTRSSWANW